MLKEKIKERLREGDTVQINDEIWDDTERPLRLAIMQQIRDEHLGDVKYGRRGQQTRIIPKQTMVRGDDSAGITPQSPVLPHTQRIVIPHKFPLDSTTDLEINLPRNLTLWEAKRIARFVESLASDDQP